MLTRPATLLEAALCGLVLLFGGSWLYEHYHYPLTEAQQVAHAVTVRDSVTLVRVDTLYRQAEASAANQRGAFRLRIDTLRLTRADTVTLKETVRIAEQVITKDSTALALADTVIAAHVVVERDLRTELQIAMRPHPAKRIGMTITALYDPVNATPLASAALGVRIIGNVSLVAVGFQRVALGETPRVFFGMSVRL